MALARRGAVKLETTTFALDGINDALHAQRSTLGSEIVLAQPGQRGIGDHAPPGVDCQRVPPVGELHVGGVDLRSDLVGIELLLVAGTCADGSASGPDAGSARRRAAARPPLPVPDRGRGRGA
ncbi:MAG: hypothetical protein QOG20_846, partial [Pseudonocardiales bacterium]|nr:hypothetical protein [Pseudonocardiales bacterium]